MRIIRALVVSILILTIFTLFSTLVFATETFFYHKDHLGSSYIITDSQGNVVSRIDYEPFGGPINELGESDYKYTGKELDNGTGLYYYGARYYDHTIGDLQPQTL